MPRDHDHQKFEPGDAHEAPVSLAGFLSADNWTTRELEIPEPLLGEVITNTTRLFIGGETGVGKTNVGFAMAGGMSVGKGFLHWSSSRPCRVLYIDGEMARDLVQERLRDLKRRMGVQDLPNLFVLCREDCEEIARMFPDMGELKPLNSPEGQAFVLKAVDMIGGIDVIVFDNRMSLLDGDMKDEVPWTQTMPLVKAITAKRIGQVWFDHMGNDTTRLYGTKTKEWQFDSVAVLEKVKRPDTDVSFSMTFTKARRRKPSNRTDFEPITVALLNDEWQVEGSAKPTTAKPPSPGAAKFFTELCNAINADNRTDATTTKERWKQELARRSMIATEEHNGTTRYEKSSITLFNQYVRELGIAGWIVADGEAVRIIRK
jgi:hypothetical protein